MAERRFFCGVGTQKLKNNAQLRSLSDHIYRTKECPNADPALKDRNETLIEPPFRNYDEAFRQREKDHHLRYRKDAVRGIGVVLESQRVMTGDELKKWKDANVKWLKDFFGEDRVVAAEFHGDESQKCMHIHAFVIPEFDGTLKASEFLNGKEKLSEMQTSYANAMKEFGLSRGDQGLMTHQDHRALERATHAEIAKSLSEPLPGETKEEQWRRNNEEYINANVKNFIEKNEMKTEFTKQISIIKNEKNELEKDLFEASENIEYMSEELRKKDAKISSQEEQIKELFELLKKEGFTQADLQNLKNIRKVLWSVKHGLKDPEKVMGELQRGLDFFEKNNRERGAFGRSDNVPSLDSTG